MKHIKAKNHKAPNGLSQWPRSTKDSNEDDAEEFLNHNSKWIVDVASAQDVPSSEDLDTNQVKCLLSTLHFQSCALNQMHSTTRVSCAPIEESNSSEKRRFHALVSLVEEFKPHFNTYVLWEPHTYNFAEDQLPHGEPNSIFTQSLLCNTDVASFIGYEFFNHHTPVELANNDCLSAMKLFPCQSLTTFQLSKDNCL